MKKPMGGNPPTPPKKSVEKSMGALPPNPHFRQGAGGGGKTDPPTPRPSVFVRQLSTRLIGIKKRANGAQFIRLKGMTEHAQQFLARETSKRALPEKSANHRALVFRFLGF